MRKVEERVALRACRPQRRLHGSALARGARLPGSRARRLVWPLVGRQLAAEHGS